MDAIDDYSDEDSTFKQPLGGCLNSATIPSAESAAASRNLTALETLMLERKTLLSKMAKASF